MIEVIDGCVMHADVIAPSRGPTLFDARELQQDTVGCGLGLVVLIPRAALSDPVDDAPVLDPQDEEHGQELGRLRDSR